MGESQYPYEPPRTVTGCQNRAKRLKCLGNAVVPAQARPFFEAMASIYSRPSYSGQSRDDNPMQVELVRLAEKSLGEAKE